MYRFCRGSNKPALVPAGIVGTACQAMVLTTVACLNVAAASSAAGGLSAVPLNFKGDRNDRNAGLQAWGHLLGSAVLFNKVPATFPHLAAYSKSKWSLLYKGARLHCSVMAVTQEVQGFLFRNQRSRQK